MEQEKKNRDRLQEVLEALYLLFVQLANIEF